MDWVQKPHPPLWYGLRSGPDGSLLPARLGMNVVTLGNEERTAPGDRAISRGLAAACRGAQPRSASPVTDPLIGMVRGLFVADTDAEAERLARPAYRKWFDNLMWLWRENNSFPTISLSQDYDEFDPATARSSSAAPTRCDARSSRRRGAAARTISCSSLLSAP